MVYAYTQDVPIKEDVYRRIVERLGTEPLHGSLLHLCVRRPDGGLRYIDVWESEEDCARAFEERVHPAVHGVFREIGFDPGAEPGVDHLEVLDATGSLLSRATT
ncbi:MAG: hypothetical protein GEV28_17930 [Actinophytocola sp.]|uniref:hypothetical protein n=1 Tax=Actinophytocola sp. TaxID=1872138 RepID=UPI0013220DBD|nr:hypothetical protein [Actinophytocola sp.]MPZ82169.1 hypothetical protein [Actinophytocola sp.]